MRTVLLIAALGLGVGCAKRTAKNAPPARDEGAKAQPPAASVKDKKDTTADETNLLTDLRFHKEAPADGSSIGQRPSVAPATQDERSAPAASGQPSPPVPDVAPPPRAVSRQPNPVPARPPAIAPDGGAPVRAAKIAVTTADMLEVWVFIEHRSGASGTMPTQSEIHQALTKGSSPAADRVKDGTLALTGATVRESVWAYETRARTDGGLVASQKGVETLSAAELKTRLGK
ncbi:hypothetical protein [Frigoriglobus tundricola]|uniref:Lipoprotein n=1 Tax=Frigoriglobus tundricola TaxID=2774151 RepID=A0A6M5YIV7_9BACT|nr:hypothetical protein [Frigoriglobus tundricola]QJW93977.1 hypothetical protein FTUN_1494 [Frigoriglobus tundricola]